MSHKHKKVDKSPYVPKRYELKEPKSNLEATLKTLESSVAKNDKKKAPRTKSNSWLSPGASESLSRTLLSSQQVGAGVNQQGARGRREPKNKNPEKQSQLQSQTLSKSKSKQMTREERKLHTSNSPDLKVVVNEVLHKIEKEGISSKWPEEEEQGAQGFQKKQDDNKSQGEEGVFSLENSRIWLSNSSSVRKLSRIDETDKSFISSEETRVFSSSNASFCVTGYLDYTHMLLPGLQKSSNFSEMYQPRKVFDIVYELIERDGRTTIMIKNIPNKYSLKLLSDEIDARHANHYDFLYLPFDFNNNCNVGYAFINFLDASSLKQFYEEFHEKRWSKFRSEKICALTYARLQGRNSLIEHFYNSKVLNQKAKPYRPIIRDLTKIKDLVTQQRKG